MSSNAHRSLIVRVPNKMNLEQSQRVLATVLGKAGCPTCYSGLKISFESAVDPAPEIMNVEEHSLQISEAGGAGR
jgi:hypothetical protein